MLHKCKNLREVAKLIHKDAGFSEDQIDIFEKLLEDLGDEDLYDFYGIEDVFGLEKGVRYIVNKDQDNQ